MRLIDGDELIELLLSTAITDKQREYSECVQYAVQEMPTVDAVPVRHGRWEWNGEAFICSACGNGHKGQPTIMGQPMFEFCPICGARMDGDDGKAD